MPRVPTYDGLQAAPSSLPQPRIQAPSLPDAGVGMRQAGQDLMQAGGAAGNLAIELQREANQVRVDDALNQAKEAQMRLSYDKSAGFTNIMGKDAFERPNGKPLADEYREMLGNEFTTIVNSLGNDAQKLAFSQQAKQMISSFHSQITQHESTQYKQYQLSVGEGTVSNRTNVIATSYQNPDAVDEAASSIRRATYNNAKLLGKSAVWADERANELVSNAHKGAVLAALESGDAATAMGYLERYSKDMTPRDAYEVRAHVTKEVEARQAFNVASAAVSAIKPLMAPTDFDRIVNITIQTESAGNPNAVSPKGAKGLMQVMDATNKDPGYGVKPAKDNSPQERVRVGRDYLAAMLKEYGGDVAKAWAAYNAGPGALNDAIKRADASRTPGADWLTFMPRETQDYVAKNMKALGSGGGAPKMPTLADVQDVVLQSLGNASPSVKKAALQEAERQFDDQIKAMKQRDDAAVADAQRTLIASNGDMNALTPSQRASIPPGQMDSVMTFAGKLSKGEAIGTDWGLYYQLNNDPQLLKNTNLMALRHKLGNTEFKQLADEQAKMSKDEGRLTQLQSANDVLKSFMAQAGINPNPKYDKTDDVAKVGQLTSAFQDRINERERATGKKLTANELREEAAALFKPVKVAGIMFDSEKPAGMVAAGDEIVVPDDDRQKIAAELKMAGRPVTTEAIESLYRKHLRIVASNQ